MMDADEEELGNLARDIDDARKHFLRARDHLRLAVKELRGGPDAADSLLMIAHERGANEVAERLADSGRELGFEKPYDVGKGEGLQRLTDLAEIAALAEKDLAHLVAVRENILAHRDPQHQRRYVLEGREVVLEIERGKIRFIDDDTSEPLHIEVVDSRGLPEKSLESLRRDRKKKRNKDK
jgi:hypothetical protein